MLTVVINSKTARDSQTLEVFFFSAFSAITTFLVQCHYPKPLSYLSELVCQIQLSHCEKCDHKFFCAYSTL